MAFACAVLATLDRLPTHGRPLQLCVRPKQRVRHISRDLIYDRQASLLPIGWKPGARFPGRPSLKPTH